uniref:S-layer homology domain-containing protein n=1 Tax=Dysosmobacter sp. TaxID=2591382 RepID=UPI00307D3AB8
VTFNGLVGVNKEGTIETPTTSLDFTAYGNSVLPPAMPDKFVVGAVSDNKTEMLVSLTVPKGATLTIPGNMTLEISGLEHLSRLTNNGTLVNDGTVSIPDATAEDIKALNLTGSGLVQVPAGTGYTYYTNGGAALGNLKVENLDLSQVVGDQGDLETDGYHWDNTDRTLTLNGLAVTGALDLPNGAEDIKIAVQKESFVNSLSHPDSYRPTVRIVGREPLTVQHMSGDIHLTLERDGALNAGEINIGAAGNKDSIIIVNGKLTVKGSEGSEGIRCGQMVIGATGVLNVSGEQGVAVFGVNGSSDRYQGAFQIAKGGTFTANCTDYNVMVLTQGITMDEAKAKTCLVLPDNYLPEGYSIQVATGDNGSDKVYAATVAKKGATLTLIAKRVDGAGGQLELKFQTAPKPGAGGGSADGSTGGGSSSGGGGGSSSSSKPSTNTGTTTKPDGTKVQTETKADGTKIQTETKKDGSTVKTTTNPNGSSVTETKAADGSTGTVKTDKNGQTEANAKVSAKAVEDAKKSGEAVKAPVEVEASRNSNTAPTVKVELPKNAGKTEVEIPVSNAKPGTVAVLVRPDGTEEILKASVSTENGIRLTVDGSATVKIVDNSKDFIDTRNHWAKDAIDFVSARELVNGMNDSIYAPNNSTTRAQLWTILARQNDADLNGGNTWYEKAQLWSKDKGISDGTQPDAAINRAQMVTMLWRTMGQPAAGGAANFNDVPANSYYAQAVAWAVENGITAGVGGGRFDPNSTCTRAQIATFLYRYMK